MKLIATDTLHISELRATPLRPGEEFEVSEATAKELIARGLASAPENKAAEPAAIKRKGK